MSHDNPLHRPAWGRRDALRAAGATGLAAALGLTLPPPATAAGPRRRGRGHSLDRAATLPAPPPPRERRPRGGGRADRTPATSQLPAPPAPPRASLRSAEVGAATGTGLSTATTTLVVYDDSGSWGWLGELYAQQTANLVSHFGGWTAIPARTYTAGTLSSYSALVYIGSTYDEDLPAAFLTDVLATTKPVIWVYDNIWRLTAADPGFTARTGWTWNQFDTSAVAAVTYKGKTLRRDTVNQSGIMDVTVVDPTRATVLATANRPDGSTFPWAVRAGNFTYLGEVPFAYVDHGDRYLAFADLLFDALAPATPTRHRALVRIEDVGPDADPAELRAVVDYLSSQRVPFSVAVYTRYVDPQGVFSGGAPQDYTMTQRPAVVSALKYARSKGGTLLMHGWTHQFGTTPNPYDGVSANDFEFFLAHVDATDRVVYDGPVPPDSTAWCTARLDAARMQFSAAGLGTPTIFEFPHYAGSPTDYRAVAARFSTRYERGLYFGGLLTGGVDTTRLNGQYFPYPVRDLYGTKVVPECVGNVEPEPFNTHPARLPADLVATAEANLVVRDGFASFFYHPYLGTGHLREVVTGIKALGYTFVAAGSV
ncbi:DUF2334 domain-containing protein [Kineococcus sp. LSe6-4]|uniref:DUF2334 domain-containing protein n=1 Tax=Kineococcus halophytocola TaxID=3234027 RepID=A0ABV4GZN9_9ACTN